MWTATAALLRARVRSGSAGARQYNRDSLARRTDPARYANSDHARFHQRHARVRSPHPVGSPPRPTTSYHRARRREGNRTSDGSLLNLRIELGCLAPVEHSVVADHTHRTVSYPARTNWRGRAPRSCPCDVAPSRNQHELSGMVEASKRVLLDQALRIGAQIETRAQRVQSRRTQLLHHQFGERNHLRLTRLGRIETLLHDRKPFGRRRIRDYLADAQVIVLEYFEAPLFLHGLVVTLRAPADHGLFVAPGRERQNARWPSLAREAVNVDEAVNTLELGPQVLGEA